MDNRFTHEISIVKLHPDAIIPVRATPGSSGFDVHALEARQIPPGKRALVKTGLSMSMPTGIECVIRPRSGLAHKNGVTVLNTPGTIDSDYRGPIGVILHNTSVETFYIEPGDRIAQFVFQALPSVRLNEAGSLKETERGEGGFGSTGV